jgi:uncharacterized membrane protein YsdA (DUF1294 family)
LWLILWLVLLASNLAAFASFGIDKKRARNGGWRIPESTLLGLALFGGIGGVYLGCWYFRHKTRKASFSTALHLIALVQSSLLAWFFMH